MNIKVMTPKEKAEKLFYKIYESDDHNGYCNGCGFDYEQAKDITLIAVDEMIGLYNNMNKNGLLKPNSIGIYLHELKQEIEKL